MNKLLNIFFVVMVSISLPTFAGSAQDTEIQFTVEAVDKFAKEVELFVAKEGARAFIIGRVGRPEKDLPKGIKFTHTAVAVYSSIILDSGETVNLPYIENFANQYDLVARLGVLSPLRRSKPSVIQIDGAVFEKQGDDAWGHLLNQHYLFGIEDFLHAQNKVNSPYISTGKTQLSQPRLYEYYDGQRPKPYCE